MTNRSRESRNPEASVRVVGDSEQGDTRKIYSRPTGSLRRKSHRFVTGIHLFSQDKGGLYLLDQLIDSTPSRRGFHWILLPRPLKILRGSRRLVLAPGHQQLQPTALNFDVPVVGLWNGKQKRMGFQIVKAAPQSRSELDDL